MPQQEKKIELRSEELQEILGHAPGALIRWGMTVFFAIVILLLAFIWFVQYPDIIYSRVMLVTADPPVHLVASASGKIELKIHDKQAAEKGMILGVIENPAILKDVFFLDSLIKHMDKYAHARPIQIDSVTIKQSLNLGELQSPYVEFTETVEEARRFITIAIYENQKQSILINISHYRDLNSQLLQQRSILSEEFEAATTLYKGDSLLYTQNAISKFEILKSKITFLNSKSKLREIGNMIVQNKVQMAQLSSQISDSDLKHFEQRDRLENNITNTFQKLENQLVAWKQRYLIVSPIDGTVSLSKFWSDNQFVTSGEEIFTVIPGTTNIVGKIELPFAGSVKVKPDQKVRMKFDNYPYTEYGMIIGKVEAISLVPVKSSYTVEVSLSHGLTSTYKKNLPFKQEMQGTAEIVTEDKRLLTRIFNQLRILLSKVDRDQ